MLGQEQINYGRNNTKQETGSYKTEEHLIQVQAEQGGWGKQNTGRGGLECVGKGCSMSHW